MTERTERELLNAIHSGRRDACAGLIHEYYQAIYRFLLRLTNDPSAAEDLTQETFAAAWEKAAAFEGRCALGTWLHRIAHGKFVDFYRAGRRSAALSERLRRRDSPAAPCPVETAGQQDEVRRLHAALQRINEADRVLLVLHYFQGLSYREMAGVTGEPAGTIKWRTSVALGRLRDVLTAEESHVPAPTRPRRDA